MRLPDVTLWLNCPFCEDIDDYPAHYRVYRLPVGVELPTNWNEVRTADLVHVGDIPVRSVRLDESRRERIDVACLAPFLEA